MQGKGKPYALLATIARVPADWAPRPNEIRDLPDGTPVWADTCSAGLTLTPAERLEREEYEGLAGPPADDEAWERLEWLAITAGDTEGHGELPW